MLEEKKNSRLKSSVVIYPKRILKIETNTMIRANFAIFLVMAVLAVVSASFHEKCHEHFESFKTKHRVRYADDQEHGRRREIFCDRMKEVDELNAKGNPVFGVTKFSDRTFEEFSVLLGRKGRASVPEGATVKKSVREPGSRHPALKGALGDDSTVDWTAAGYVTPVKNQGQCGSCWSMSAASQIESDFMLAGNAMWEFSPQQIASCTKNCFGCGGGDTPAAYEYLMGLPSGEGLGSAAFAPYVQSMTEQCLGKRCTESCDKIDLTTLETKSSLTGYYATVTDYNYATEPCTGACDSQNMTALAASLASSGPASVCVNAANWASYTGGVMTSAQCGGFAYGDLDHCVQLTGYNSDEGYWAVRNSWSTDWGIDGYIRLEMADGVNPCGIANEATMTVLGDTKGDDKHGGGK